MSNEKTTRISVPIKPHLKKFCLKAYDLTEPVKLEEDNLLGQYVMSVLQDKRGLSGKQFNNINSQFNGDKSDLLTETIVIELSSEMVKRSPRVAKLVRINIHLQYFFRISIINFIKASGMSGTNPYNACKLFLKMYDFDENEYTLDGVHQVWKRYQSSNAPKKKSEGRTKNIKAAYQGVA